MEFKIVSIEISTIMRTSLFLIMVGVPEIIGPADIIRYSTCHSYYDILSLSQCQ